jgi:drug/metabolite transporter (DMT)-like permease
MGALAERCVANAASLGIVAFYAVSAISMTLANKAAVHALPHPYFLCIIQNATTLVFALLIALWLAPGHEHLGLRLQLERSILGAWAPALLLFILMLISSMTAMEYITVPTVLVFRALTPLATALIAAPVLGELPSGAQWLSLVVIVIGALCYLTADATFSAPGYAWMLVNLISAAAYHVYVKATINKYKPSAMDLVLLNNGLSIPLLAVLGLILDDPSGLAASFGSIGGSGWAAIIVSCLIAGCIAFSGFLLQASVSPTTATVINHLTKVCTFIASYIIFQDSFGPWMLVGIILTLGGTVGYSWYSSQHRKAEAPPPAHGDDDGGAPSATPLKVASEGPAPSCSCGGRPVNEATGLLSNARTTGPASGGAAV